jgi:hypothetical protein
MVNVERDIKIINIDAEVEANKVDKIEKWFLCN